MSRLDFDQIASHRASNLIASSPEARLMADGESDMIVHNPLRELAKDTEDAPEGDAKSTVDLESPQPKQQIAPDGSAAEAPQQKVYLAKVISTPTHPAVLKFRSRLCCF